MVKWEKRGKKDVCLTACSWQICVSLSSCSSRTALAFSYCWSSISISTFTCSTYATATETQEKNRTGKAICYMSLLIYISDNKSITGPCAAAYTVHWEATFNWIPWHSRLLFLSSEEHLHPANRAQHNKTVAVDRLILCLLSAAWTERLY